MEITTISLLGIALLLLVCFALILYPIFSQNVGFHTKLGNDDLLTHKEALMIGLNEIEFEHKTEKISDADFLILKKQYEQELVKMIKSEENIVNNEDIEATLLAEVEQEIAEALKTVRKGSKQEGEG